MAAELHPDPRRGRLRDPPLRDNASDWIFEGTATKEECRPPHIRGNPQGSQDIKGRTSGETTTLHAHRRSILNAQQWGDAGKRRLEGREDGW